MQLKTGSFIAMAEDIIRKNSKIVIWGAGVIGSVITPEILAANGIDSYVECYIDNDRTRWGTDMELGGRTVKIYSPDRLKIMERNTVVLMTISRYYDAFEQLRLMECTGEMSCYIIPMMCIRNFCGNTGNGALMMTSKPVIPKVLHYMWLGNKPMPEKLEKCVESWKTFCPDYEIVRWDETNYDVHKNAFVAEAYDNGRYGFVPDFARLDILHQYGGIYMDTDVEVVRSLDELLYQRAFCGVEKWQVLNFGGCCGAVKGHAGLEPFLERWSERRILREDGTLDSLSSGLIDTEIALQAGYQMNGENQNVLGINIYTFDYFHPYDYMSGMMHRTAHTFSIHHFNGGWLDEGARASNRKTTQMYEELTRHAITMHEGA